MTFAQKLRALRDAAGLSEAKLAQASGISFASIHEYGLGRRKPSFEAVVKIAAALETTCEAFASCEDISGNSSPRGRPPKAPPGVPPAEELQDQAKAGPRAKQTGKRRGRSRKGE